MRTTSIVGCRFDLSHAYMTLEVNGNRLILKISGTLKADGEARIDVPIATVARDGHVVSYSNLPSSKRTGWRAFLEILEELFNKGSGSELCQNYVGTVNFEIASKPFRVVLIGNTAPYLYMIAIGNQEIYLKVEAFQIFFTAIKNAVT